ncbi:GNAT family N-acetyltransferase [Jonesia quinghaiensis]|uniref:GNAT family N-acetyltransferase n=1 Tax=Jonesia quinghaiensis TaxID=262806 RepID=UPI000685C7FF|nr:GNAT family N-acetyltransferase [Jonesia quinghaiensis]
MVIGYFGVARHRQGRGVGQALLHHALAVFDVEVGAAIHCETSDARNVTLYERHGWNTTDTTYIPDGPTVWSMLRRVGGGSRR